MTAYVLAHIDVTDPGRYEDYKKISPISIEKFGGRFVTRGGEVTVLEGTVEPKRLVLIEFPSVEAAKEWHASSDYAEAKALRQSASTGDLILMEGV